MPCIEFRLLPRLGEQCLGRIIQRLGALSGEILDLELEPAGGGNARDRGRVEAERDRVRYGQKLRAHRVEDMRGGERRTALVPRLQQREFHRRIRLIGAGQEIRSGDRDHILHTVLRRQDRANLLGDRLGPLQRGAVGKLDHREEVALILDRQEILLECANRSHR